MVVPLPGPTDAGLKLQEVPAGRPEQEAAVKLIVPLYPFAPVTVRVVVAVPPAATVTVVGVGGVAGKDRLKSAGRAEVHALLVTKLKAFTEPSPEARLKPPVLLNPIEPARGPV